MIDRFTKLTQAIPVRQIDALSVVAVFVDNWLFRYGFPRQVLSDNGSQFASKFFLGVCQMLGIANAFESTYHPQMNGQTERYNTILQMLRCYVADHQQDWDTYVQALTYAYHTAVHRSTGCAPFDLALSRPPAEFYLQAEAQRARKSVQDQRADFVQRMKGTLEAARSQLAKAQARYKRDFDRRIRPTNRDISPGDFVFIDPEDGK